MLQDKVIPHFLIANNHQPNYPLFIYLPGMDGTGKLLRGQLGNLTKRFDVRCLVIPGDDLNDWEILSSQLLNLVKQELQQHPQRSIYLCGESFGGCLALKVALREPQLFEKIILVNCASSFLKKPFLSWGIQLVQSMPEFLYRQSVLILLPFLIVFRKVTSQNRYDLTEAMKSLPPQTVSWRLSLLRDFRTNVDNLRLLQQPVLIVAGAADQLLPSVKEAQYLASHLPNGQVMILPESGHACLLEKGIDLDKIIEDWEN
ncbi:MAG: alpha/beta hydrolase [Spirulinaceae cyanobacterium]